MPPLWPLWAFRGIEGSTAQHERAPPLRPDCRPCRAVADRPPPRVLMNPEAWAEEQAESIAEQIAPTIARARTAESDRTARKAAEATGREGAPEARADRESAGPAERHCGPHARLALARCAGSPRLPAGQGRARPLEG